MKELVTVQHKSPGNRKKKHKHFQALMMGTIIYVRAVLSI